MAHEYRGTTCLRSNVANTQSNTPPGIFIHVVSPSFGGAKGSPPRLLDRFQWPTITDPSEALKRAHFLCRLINFPWVFSKKAKSLSHFACGLLLTDSHLWFIFFFPRIKCKIGGREYSELVRFISWWKSVVVEWCFLPFLKALPSILFFIIIIF